MKIEHIIKRVGLDSNNDYWSEELLIKCAEQNPGRARYDMEQQSLIMMINYSLDFENGVELDAVLA